MTTRNLVLLAVLIAVSAASNTNKAWQEWKTTYGKSYGTDVEDAHRMKIWLETTQRVRIHNEEYAEGLHTYTQIVGKFADSTIEELRATHFSSSMQHCPRPAAFHPKLADSSVPESIDWRNNNGNFVTPVKNQDQCGSCWAFGATGGLESRCAIKYGAASLTSLSEQQLVSCDKEESACTGGCVDSAWEWLNANGGSDTEADYPYVSGNGYVPPCETNHAGHSTPGNVVRVPQSEADLKVAVAQGPVSVGIEASDKLFWANFTDGQIFYDPECLLNSHGIGHALLIVGYGSNTHGDYWIAKNSWGADWGDQGYALMARNRDNNCDIASYASYPQCA